MLLVLTVFILAEHYYVTFGFGMGRPSVVCDVALYRQQLELFGNIFAPPVIQGHGQFVLKF